MRVNSLIPALCLGLISSFISQELQANDGAFGSAGGSLIPLKNDHVKMVSEDIVLEVKEATQDTPDYIESLEWHVNAHYVFKNTSSDVVTVKVGFPELACDGDSPCPEDHPYSFHDLETRVRGKKIKHTTEMLSKQKRLKKGFGELDKVHLFQVTFAPKEVIEITHTYRHTLSSSSEGRQIDYVTRTGALWSSPIGRATFTVKLPWSHLYTSYPDEFVLKSRTEHVLEKTMAGYGSMWTYVFEMKDWTPRGDLLLHFGNAVERLPQHCPDIQDVSRAYQEALAVSGQDSALTTRQRKKMAEAKAGKLFDELDATQLKQCRNWPYAIHGYVFKNKSLHDYFYAKEFSTHCPFCGKSERTEVLDEDNPVRFTRFFHKPNKSYSPELLTARELLYVRVVKGAESRLRAQ